MGNSCFIGLGFWSATTIVVVAFLVHITIVEVTAHLTRYYRTPK